MKKAILTTIICCMLSSVFANNIVVSNTFLSNQNTSTNNITINFDVAWENSWRTYNNESNYDGAWIFVKFRVNGTTGDWSHCHINPTGFSPNPSATILVPPSDSMGAFIYSSSISNTIGNVNYTSNQIIWNYGLDNVNDNDSVQIQVFALEMVYIPTGDYYLGSGGTETDCFKEGGTTSTAYHVQNANSITLGNIAGTLNIPGLVSGTTIPQTYPNGFNAFWIMKYECSQQQYADFLNHIESAKANALLTSGGGSGNFTGVHPNIQPVSGERANNNVGINENLAIADWSGLRPLSELEFEKACRGVGRTPVVNEFAWGNTNIRPLLTVNGTGPNEVVATPLDANAVVYIGGPGFGRPVRVGLFARSSASSRDTSGATYYGVMNMSDNLFEITAYSGNSNGQNVNSSIHGDGYLSGNGNSNQSNWVLNAFGLRGGCWASGSSWNELRISYRALADYIATNNNNGKGIRLVRTAP